MRRIARLLALVFVAAAVPAAAPDWIDYQPAGVGYRIALPGSPTVTTQEVPTRLGVLKNITASVEIGNRAFVIMHIDYPTAHVESVPAARILDGVRDGQAQSGKLRSERAVTIGRHAARQLIIDAAGESVTVSRIVLVGRRLIQAIYAGPRGSEDDADTKRFIDSLAIVDR